VDGSPASSNISFVRFIKNLKRNYLLTCIISVLILFVIFYSYFLSYRTFLKEGDIVPYDINSPITVRYTDKEETEKLRKQAEEKVPVIYRKNTSVDETVISDIENFFLILKTERKNKIKKTEDKLSVIEKLLRASKDPRKVAEFLISVDDKNLTLVQNLSISLSRELLKAGIQEAELGEIPQKVKNLALSKDSRENIADVVTEIIMTYIRPNFMIDEEATDRLKEEARQKIVPVINTILRNEKIAQKGERVTPKILDKLKATGILSSSNRTLLWIISITYPLFLTFLILFYIYKLGNGKIISDFRYFVLLYAFILLFVAIVRFTITISFSPFIIPAFIFLIPLIVLYGSKHTLFLNSSVLLISLIAFGYDISITAAYVVAGLFAIMFFSRFRTLSEFMTKSLYSAIVLSLVMLLFNSFPQENSLYANKFLVMGISFVNGFVSCLLAIGIIFAVEHCLNLLTPLRLFELSDPNSPILRKLFESAPGTYQHSVVVANLSSHAAEAIGCDSLLARVGSYYHDLGKIEDPLLYSENSSGSNLLDKMDALSALSKIKSHISAGLKIANEYKLPTEIKNFITEHHGTSKISFIYDKVKSERNPNIDEKSFRYDGPKPQSRETAIVMLADSTEASVRSLKDIRTETLEKLVDNIIKAKLSDGQLDDTPLTLKNLSIIRESFVSTLGSLYHTRIAYPEERT